MHVESRGKYAPAGSLIGKAKQDASCVTQCTAKQQRGRMLPVRCPGGCCMAGDRQGALTLGMHDAGHGAKAYDGPGGEDLWGRAESMLLHKCIFLHSFASECNSDSTCAVRLYSRAMLCLLSKT
eukprot:1158738-Pelagomonas_calceolata.AAC.2